MGIRNGLQNWPVLAHHVFFYITWMAWRVLPQEHMTPANLGYDVCVDITLTCTTYLGIIIKPAHRRMETIFPDDCVILLQHIELLPPKRNGLVMV